MSQLGQLFLSLRPHQWTKNLVLLAALVFAERLFDVPSVLVASAAFVIFCLLSSAVYLVNDLADLEQDRKHPVKRNRPLAAGKLSARLAIGAAVVLVTGGLAASYWLAPGFGVVATIYFATMIAYSFILKNIVILDVLIVAFGFVLRAVAGALATRRSLQQLAFDMYFASCSFSRSRQTATGAHPPRERSGRASEDSGRVQPLSIGSNDSGGNGLYPGLLRLVHPRRRRPWQSSVRID